MGLNADWFDGLGSLDRFINRILILTGWNHSPHTLTGVIILPTQTMHCYEGNPSNLP